jgi:hypothetical protein
VKSIPGGHRLRRPATSCARAPSSSPAEAAGDAAACGGFYEATFSAEIPVMVFITFSFEIWRKIGDFDSKCCLFVTKIDQNIVFLEKRKLFLTLFFEKSSNYCEENW